MATIRDYFLEAERRAGSGNRLAAALRTSNGNLSRIRMSIGGVGDDLVIRLADFLGEDPRELLVLAQAERSAESAREYWRDIYDTVKKTVAVILLIVGFGGIILPRPAAAETKKSIHYQTLFPRIRRRLEQLLEILRTDYSLIYFPSFAVLPILIRQRRCAKCSRSWIYSDRKPDS